MLVARRGAVPPAERAGGHRRARAPSASRCASSSAAGVDARGSTPYFGVDADGAKLFVKALGADERSADLLFRLYRRLLPATSATNERSCRCSAPSSTRRSSRSRPGPSACGRRACGRSPTAEPNGYVLAYEAIDGKSLDRVDPGEVTDDVLAAIWRLVGELRRHRIAHRDLRLANIFLDDHGQVWLIDFGFGEVAASDLLLATDVAELLASSSLCVGPERAVAHAAGASTRRRWRGPSTGSTRGHSAGRHARRSRPAPGLLDDLRERLAARRRPRTMNLWWLILAGAGLIVLRLRSPPPASRSSVRRRSVVFHAVNGLPDWLYVFLWLPMQLGNLVVGTGAGLAVALVARDLVVAVGVILAMGLKLVTERIVRREMADYLAIRQRPGTSQTGAILAAVTCRRRARASPPGTSSWSPPSGPSWRRCFRPRGGGCRPCSPSS